MSSIVHGGLDVHAESISAHLLNAETGEVVTEEVPCDRQSLLRAVRRWSKLGELRLCYEASGAGFVIKRWLDEAGVQCEVIAPSLIPKAPGDRVKTDKRDARKLAQFYQAGMLQPVRVPDEEEETVRALVRLREDLTRDMTRVKNRLLKYLRTLGLRYKGGERWTEKHRAWLAGLALNPMQRMIVQSHLEGLDSLLQRRQEIDRKIAELAQTARYRTGVGRLTSLRGIALYSAMVLLTEIGDARRFGKPGALMAYFGLVPSESSSGGRRRTGSITKTGNRRVRWILTEAAWGQRWKVGCSERLRRHWRTQPEEVVAIAKKAQQRLHDKYWKIAVRKDNKIAVTAVAREMAGFVWALLTLEVA